MRRASPHRESGASLIVALLLLILVVAFGLAMHANARNLVVSNQTLRHDTQCRWAAEGGIAAARAALAEDASYAGTTFDVGAVPVAITVSPVAGAADRRLVIAEATTSASGIAPRGGRSRIDVVLRLTDGLPVVERWTER